MQPHQFEVSDVHLNCCIIPISHKLLEREHDMIIFIACKEFIKKKWSDPIQEVFSDLKFGHLVTHSQTDICTFTYSSTQVLSDSTNQLLSDISTHIFSDRSTQLLSGGSTKLLPGSSTHLSDKSTLILLKSSTQLLWDSSIQLLSDSTTNCPQ